MSRPNGKGRHCNCRAWAMALLMAVPLAWSQTPPKPAGVAKAQAQPSPASKPLNLYMGHASDLLSTTQWERLLATQPVDEEDPDVTASEPEVVKVTGERSRPQVPDGIAGVFWAIRNPAQAWRIFVPNP